MQKLLLIWLAMAMAGSLRAQTNPVSYAEYGQLLMVKLETAPFPHPARAEGHKYQKEFYSAREHYGDSTVGIFVPKGFREGERVDFVVHFHGWHNHVENVLSHYQLIQQMAASGRNAILVVPQGPYDAPDSFGGKLEDAQGFERFIESVRDTLRQKQILTGKPIGSIVLTGHSGGYHVMAAILDHGGLSDKVREVWLFDGLYGGTENFMAWFDRAPGQRFIDIYTERGGTKEETEKLVAARRAKGIPLLAKTESEITTEDLRKNRLIFSFTPLEHDEVPFKHRSFEEFLKTSCLAEIPKEPGGK